MKHLLTLEEMHQRELVMMRLFHEFCQEHHLRYYMCGGTLLGAVRHQGFIPWDDDVDLLMPRPDYEKLQKLVVSQPYMPRYEFHSYSLGNLRENFTKLVDLHTLVDKDFTFDEYDQNLWIDIFPMDGLPEDDKEIEKIYKKVKRARRILKFLKAKPGTGSSRVKAVVKPLLKPIVGLVWSKDGLLRHIDQIAKNYDFESSEHVGGIVYGYGPQEKMVRRDYVKPIEMRFEDMTAIAPGCYDEYLRALFDDYMELPPEDKRQVHFMKIYGW